jgi:hypothetical protein
MRCIHIVGIALLACTLSMASKNAWAQESERAADAAARYDVADRPISQGQYIAGGLVGTFVGYGIGHAIIGEYGNIGWVFTVTEALATVTAITGWMMLAFSAMGDPGPGADLSARNRTGDIGLAVMGVGALASTGFHIWEVVDVWSRPTDRIVKKGGFGADATRVGIVPMAFGDGRIGLMAGCTF